MELHIKNNNSQLKEILETGNYKRYLTTGKYKRQTEEYYIVECPLNRLDELIKLLENEYCEFVLLYRGKRKNIIKKYDLVKQIENINPRSEAHTRLKGYDICLNRMRKSDIYNVVYCRFYNIQCF